MIQLRLLVKHCMEEKYNSVCTRVYGFDLLNKVAKEFGFRMMHNFALHVGLFTMKIMKVTFEISGV